MSTDTPEQPIGWLYDWVHSSATGRPDEAFTGFAPDEQAARRHDSHFNVRPVYAAPTQAVPKTDWKAIARVQSAKLSVALDEPGARERLQAVMNNADWKKEPAAPVAELVEALRALLDEQDAQQGYATPAAYDRARAALSRAPGAGMLNV